MLSRNKGVGAGLIILGGFFFIVQAFNFSLAALSWPLFMIVPGILMLLAGYLASESVAGLVIPGSIVTTVGLILFWQNITGHFETWSYAWGLIIAAVGVGVMLQGQLTHSNKLNADGRQLALIGLGLFATFGVFFEFFIFRNFLTGFAGRYLLPGILIAAGVALLFRRTSGDKVPDMPPQPQS